MRALESPFYGRYEIDPATGCWNWQGHINEKGYGTLSYNSKSHRAHRFSYTLHKGPIPFGAQVMHACDNRRCVNPEHLSLGTNKDNVADMFAKGRQAPGERKARRGEANGQAKITSAQARAIREEYKRGSQTHGTNALSRKYGVHHMTISKIVRGVAWKEAAS